MTGWRIGNIIAPDYLIRTIQTINENVVFTAPSISQRAAIAALKYRRSVQPPMVEEYRSRTYYAAELVNGIEWMSTAYPPKGSFLSLCQYTQKRSTSEQAAEQILKEAHVLTLPGNAFGRCGEGYLRIACTVGKEKLKEAFERIAGWRYRYNLCSNANAPFLRRRDAQKPTAGKRHENRLVTMAGLPLAGLLCVS